MHCLAILCLAFALAACATTPSGLHRGVPTPTRPPPAPTFRPEGAAPHTAGMPGSLRVAPPRSPHRRELPPSAGQGLWSGDRAEASRQDGPTGWRTRPPIILSTTLPLDASAPSDGEDAIYGENVRACAVIAHSILSTLMSEAEVSKLRANEARCLAGSLWRLCASKDRARLNWASRHMEINDFLRRAYERNVTESQAFQDEACSGRAFSSRVRDWHLRALAKWDTFDWRWPVPDSGP